MPFTVLKAPFGSLAEGLPPLKVEPAEPDRPRMFHREDFGQLES